MVRFWNYAMIFLELYDEVLELYVEVLELSGEVLELNVYRWNLRFDKFDIRQ